MLLAESLLGSSSVAANYIEDVFSTYLYTGTGASQTITNGVDLSTKGGMVWIKSRSAATNNFLFDTARGTTKEINSNTTDAEATLANSLTAFNTDGFTVNSATGIGVNAATYASWTFRKQAKFFDVVTYTGNGVSGRTINHNLGSVPGCIIVKCTSQATAWAVYHRSLNIAGGHALMLNVTDASASLPTFFNSTTATSTAFTVGNAQATNQNTSTYVAYLFAHDAGGFGATGTDNVISCGSYTGNGSTTGPTITLGYEPQFLLVKQTNAAGTDWRIQDNMRSLNATGTANLFPNYDFAEIASPTVRSITPTATGFFVNPSSSIDDYNASGGTYIYIAIRRGPMKTPTTGTSVFSPITQNGGAFVNTGFVTDLMIQGNRPTYGLGSNGAVVDRLRNGLILAISTNSENSISYHNFSYNNGVKDDYSGGTSDIYWSFRRAPGFFDVVCYTGTGANRTVSHNLGVVPELIIVKSRSSATFGWVVGSNFTASNCAEGALNTTAGFGTYTYSNQFTAQPTAANFTLGAGNATNQSSGTYIAYLFATVAGVSKVGSYTGTGTTNQINCGFTGGARFVLIKRTDSTGDWYVWDSARGIVAGNDPYLLLNSTAAEVTNTDYVDTYSAGFEISSTAPAAINANGGSYIFLAIA